MKTRRRTGYTKRAESMIETWLSNRYAIAKEEHHHKALRYRVEEGCYPGADRMEQLS